MNLEISSFADPGQPSKERLVLKALADINVGEYAIFRSRVSEGNPTAGWKGAYWFPDAEVKANDLIVLYTKKGSQSTKDLERGRTAHFFYWGRDDALWGDKNYGAVALWIAEWNFRLAP